MNTNATEARVVWLGAADGLAEVRAAITNLATVPESLVREAVDSLAKPSRGGGMATSTHFIINHTLPPMPDPFAPVNNRAARRARKFGRASQ